MPSTRIDSAKLTPRKRPRQARSEATVQAIVEAAAQVFERHGYAAGTTNRIAERAGVSIGSLYQYFPNKDAILVALVRRHVAEGAAMLAPRRERLRAGESIEEVLPDVVRATIALHATTPRLHRVLFEETPIPPALRAELAALEDGLAQELAGALRAHDSTVPLQRLRLCAHIAIATIEGLTHRLVLRPPPDADAESIGVEIVVLMRAYLDTIRDRTRPAQ